VRADDVVWDPFVGSGLELCERAILGPYRALVGSDIDEKALAVARANLDAAGAPAASLLHGDARTLVPPGPAPTLIVSNPPLGRRVQRSGDLGLTLERFVGHAAELLAPGGRIAWISPFPRRTREAAEAKGMRVTMAQEVDMGGFAAEMQVLGKPAR
jgi:tRNA G10  N-methylase Trm11